MSVLREIKAATHLTRFVLFNFPLELLLDSYFFGYIAKANLYVAHFMKVQISGYSEELEIEFEKEMVTTTSFLKDHVIGGVVKGGAISHYLAYSFPLYAGFLEFSKHMIEGVESKLSIIKPPFPSGAYISGLVDGFEQLHFSAHIYESFIEPYINILYQDKSLEECINDKDLEIEMSKALIAEMVSNFILQPMQYLNSYSEISSQKAEIESSSSCYSYYEDQERCEAVSYAHQDDEL
jgi:hypothetical protein